MATTDCTLGCRFAKSKFLAKTYTLHSNGVFNPVASPNTGPSCSPYLDESLAELMETLRLQVNAMLRSSLPVQKRSRLLRNYWEIQYLVRELRLLFDSEALCRLVQGHQTREEIGFKGDKSP